MRGASATVGCGTGRASYGAWVGNAIGQPVGNVVTVVPVTLDGRESAVGTPVVSVSEVELVVPRSR